MKLTINILAVATGMAALLIPAADAAVERQIVAGRGVPLKAMTQPVGALAAETPIDLALGLPLRNREALTNLIAELYDPASTNYHHYLTAPEFAAKFGPSEQDYQALIAYAQANGWEVTQVHPNRTLLDVRAPAAAIEQGLHVKMGVYQHPTEARTFFAPSVAPSVDLPVTLLGVQGLDNYSQRHSLVHQRTPAAGLKALTGAGSGPGGNYRGNDFRAAYAPGVALTGAGQVVGLLELDGYFPADVTAYENLTGLPKVALTNVLVNGFNGSAGADNIEVTLDIDMVLAMAPGVARIVVYEAANTLNSFDDVLNVMANDNVAKQLSSSWGGAAQYDALADQIYQQFAVQGQSFFQAAGDHGSFFDGTDQFEDSPYITIVGGTTLTTDSAGGPWASETVWNWLGTTPKGTSGTGGGISQFYSIPDWQRGINMQANKGSSSLRNVPDVAMTADDIYIVANNGQPQIGVGGTSAAAPLWAGFAALVNQQAAGSGRPPVGFLNPALYLFGTGSNAASGFHDITVGNNTNASNTNLFFAVPGYDLCTGLGTPAGANLINALAPPPAGQIIVVGQNLVGESFSPTNGVADPGETVTVNVGLVTLGAAAHGNVVATLLVGGGVAAPGAAQTYGAMGPGSPAVTRPFTFTTYGTCGNVITATLQLQDGAVNLGTVSFNLTLGNFVPRNALLQNFDGGPLGGLPTGWTATRAGDGSIQPWALTTSLAVSQPFAVFVHDFPFTGETALVSPVFAIKSPSAQISFLHQYYLSTNVHGGVLELSVNNGPYVDILAAGGTFLSGGYNGPIYAGYGGPLAGRQAWTGTQPSMMQTVATFPATAIGQNVRLRWRYGSVASYVVAGWYMDDVKVTDGGDYSCNPSGGMPTMVSPRLRNGNFTFLFQTASNKNYTVLSKAVNSGVWTPRLSVKGDGTPKVITNLTTSGHSLFRISSP